MFFFIMYLHKTLSNIAENCHSLTQKLRHLFDHIRTEFVLCLYRKMALPDLELINCAICCLVEKSSLRLCFYQMVGMFI